MRNQEIFKELFSKPRGAKNLRESAILKASEVKGLLRNERGSMGIKEIAITVAVIVVIAAATTAITGKAPGWVDDMWTMFTKKIKDVIG